MFEIRKDVEEQMRDEALGEDRARIIAALRSDHPDLTSKWSSDQMKRIVDYAIDQSEPYGLQCERSIFVFCCAMSVYGLQFDTDPRYAYWTQDLLHDEEMDESIKRQLIEFRIHLDTGRRV